MSASRIFMLTSSVNTSYSGKLASFVFGDSAFWFISSSDVSSLSGSLLCSLTAVSASLSVLSVEVSSLLLLVHAASNTSILMIATIIFLILNSSIHANFFLVNFNYFYAICQLYCFLLLVFLH